MGETFVLLHGSWHGGWAWEPTAWCLREFGHTAYAPTARGIGQGWAGSGSPKVTMWPRSSASSRGELRDVVLVGHSFGGSVVSRVSQEIRGRLKRLVFHTAFVVADGTSVNDNIDPAQTALFAQSASASPDNTVECPWEVFRDLFIQDAPVEEARSVWERVVPQPFAPWDARLDLAEFYRAGLPRSFIAVTDDRALPEGTWHPGMSSRLGRCKIVEVAGSHEVMFTRPAELARKLAEAANN